MSNNLTNTETRSPDADADHVAAARNGDLDAFEALVLKHQRRMLNIALRLTNDYDDACEVVQDAFVSAYKKLGTFRGDSKFTTWLTAITVNLSKNRLRASKIRRMREPVSLDAPIATEDGEVMPDPPSQEPLVLDRMIQKDTQKAVQHCISVLEPDFREALVLRDIQGFAYDEISGMLKVREGTVKSRIFRARESVKECLKKVLGSL